ncbi:MAG: hypothetical protein A4E64_03160 [Syntrophorhabdus sp. PtaU1.Bin058]|nr:MAG: hypothetical protein A4E64_03160 [Syntrophorhabdus sp. PtaU1.Bin058]
MIFRRTISGLTRMNTICRCLTAIAAIVIGLSVCVPCATADENWGYMVWTTEEDCWYVGPTISYGSRGHIQSAKTFLKFVPKKGSSTYLNIKRLLRQDRMDPERFEYFVEAADINCRTGTFSVARVIFYDSDDNVFYDTLFRQPRQYAAAPGSPYRVIADYLCGRGSSTFSIARSLRLMLTP